MTPSHARPTGILLLAAALAAGPQPVRAEEPAAPAVAEPPVAATADETLTVTGRLARAPQGAARVTVVPAAELDAPTAASLPEALAAQPGLVAVDQTGNGRQLDLDVRGFAGGQGATVVLVDGVRLDEPETGGAALELVPLFDVESAEVVAGPLGPVLGGGSLAGAIRLSSRAPRRTPHGAVRLSLGSFGRRAVAASGGGAVGAWALEASALRDESDGFRDGAGTEETGARIAAAGAAGPLALAVSLASLDGRWRHPGSLTADELAEDPSQSGHDRLDFQATRHDLLTVRLAPRAEDPRHSWSAVLHARRREGEILTTGRTGYGFLTDESLGAFGFAVEDRRASRSGRLAVRWGAEGARDVLDVSGFATGSTENAARPADLELTPTSEARSRWDRLAGFGGVELRPTPDWLVELAARWDRSRVERAGRELSFEHGRWEDVAGRRSFGDVTWGVGAARTWSPGTATVTWRGRLGTSFLAPTSTQLFAYPGFGSNPDLRPQRGLGVVQGIEWRTGRVRGFVDAFATRVDDEIAYDEGRRRNLNAARTLRAGLEIDLDVRVAPRLRLRLGAVIVDARFRRGWDPGGSGDRPVEKGDAVPLVPEHQARLGLELGPWAGLRADLSVRRVGPAPLSDDYDGSLPRLPARDVVAVALSRRHALTRGALEWRVGVDNLLDESFAVRGIEAWDPLAVDPADAVRPFYTPGAPRAWALDLTWTF